jgi:hypothetical protein
VHLVTSPIFAMSILALVINDHLLKRRWPSLITGKLSDVAGVAMVALLLTAVSRRPAASFGATAVLFAALKSIPVAARWAAPVLGGTTLTDRTDVLALAVLVPLWRWVHGSSSVTSPSSHWLLPLQVLAISGAVLATTATSCDSSQVIAIGVVDGGFVVDSNGAAYISDDLGSTWTYSEGSTWTYSENLSRRGSLRESVTEACNAGGQCWSLSGQSVVETSADGAREVAFVFSDAEVAAQQRNSKSICAGVAGDGFIAIAAIESAEGTAVVITMGSQGVLVRDPTGEWSGVEVGAAEPISTDSFRLPEALFVVLALVSAVGAVAAIWIYRSRTQRTDQRVFDRPTAFVVLSMYLLVPIFMFGSGGATAHRRFGVWGIVALSVVCISFAVEWFLAGRRQATTDWRPPKPFERVG